MEIKPALTAKQWQEWHEQRAKAAAHPVGMMDHEEVYDIVASHVNGPSVTIKYRGGFCGGSCEMGAAFFPMMIAALNDALPNDDPRKITREYVEGLRRAASLLLSPGPDPRAWAGALYAIAERLAAMLPPEEVKPVYTQLTPATMTAAQIEEAVRAIARADPKGAVLVATAREVNALQEELLAFKRAANPATITLFVSTEAE